MTTRRNRITGEPILFAPARAARPGAFLEAQTGGRCPFCPGHESDTPPTIAASGDPWRVRVFANKYPPAEGAEVIVESPSHDGTFESISHAAECVVMYRDRMATHRGAAHVALFRNDGAAAGSSIPHIHSQLVPLPFVPPRIAREAAAFAGAASCPLCCTASDDHVVQQRTHFRWIAPADSSMAYQQRIVPRRHVQELSAFTQDELTELAELLQSAALATRRVSAAFNWMFMSFRDTPAAHFYIDVMPRLTAIAGLELATGTFVEIVDPATAARRLRD